MYSNLFVCVFGVGTVFAGLVCLIVLCWIMSAVCQRLEKEESHVPAPEAGKAIEVCGQAEGKGQKELEVAVAAVIAEELRVGIERVRIVSMVKI